MRRTCLCVVYLGKEIVPGCTAETVQPLILEHKDLVAWPPESADLSLMKYLWQESWINKSALLQFTGSDRVETVSSLICLSVFSTLNAEAMKSVCRLEEQTGQ